MKKEIAMVLTALLALFVLTGCGSSMSEEQKALEEIGRQMQKEAKEEGADLSKMLQEEKAASESRMASRSEEREAKQKLREELNAYYDPLLQEEYDALIAAETPEDTLAHGRRYNELIEERNARGKEMDVRWSGRSDYMRLDASYIAKAMYLSTAGYSDWECMTFARNAGVLGTTDADRIMLVYADKNDVGNWKELVFVKEDGSVCKLDLSGTFEPESSISIETVSETAVQLCAIEHADWNWYLFDVSGPEGTLTAKSTELGEEAYRAKLDETIGADEKMGQSWDYAPSWGTSLEELNDMILRNTSGCAADKCGAK